MTVNRPKKISPIDRSVLKVGKDSVYCESRKKKTRKFAYRDIQYDFDDWVDANKYLPADYDLVYIKTNIMTCIGWSVGYKWDGLKVGNKPEVLFWKRKD